MNKSCREECNTCFMFTTLFSVSYMKFKIINLLCCAYIVYRVSRNELHNFKKERQDSGKFLICSAGCQQISSMGGWQ
jgi:hypothetical protein